MMQGVVTNPGMGLWNSALWNNLMPAWMCVTCIGSGVSQLSTSAMSLALAVQGHILASLSLQCYYVMSTWCAVEMETGDSGTM